MGKKFPMVDDFPIDWQRLLSCTNEEKKHVLLFVESLAVLWQEYREIGVFAFDNFALSGTDTFERVAFKLLANSCPHDMLLTILYNMIISADLSNEKYFEYILCTVFIFAVQNRAVDVNTIRTFLTSYLGLGYMTEL